MKCKAHDEAIVEPLVYPLLRKNYDELRYTDVLVPRLLVVVLVPPDEGGWMSQSAEELVLRRCAYWVNLQGREPTLNRKTVSVHLPARNLFSVASLRDLMARASRKESL